MRKAFVLFSGGIDSTTCLMMARTEEYNEVEAVSINYGQRHKKEIECGRIICSQLSVGRSVIDARGLLAGSSMLTDSSRAIPEVSYADLPEGVSPTYVPFRNGLMLSLITTHAQKWIDAVASLVERGEINTADIYFGAHADDGANWAYPDCTPEFIGAMANAIYVGSYHAIRLRAPLQYLDKADVVGIGNVLGAPYEMTWSCYRGEEKHCGVCPTCRSRKEAFAQAGIDDPTEYAS